MKLNFHSFSKWRELEPFLFIFTQGQAFWEVRGGGEGGRETLLQERNVYWLSPMCTWLGTHPACALTRNRTCDLPVFRTAPQPTELHGPGQKVRTFYAWSSSPHPSFSTLWYCFGQLGPPTASLAGLTLNPGSCLLEWEACFLVPVTSIGIYHKAEHMAAKWMSKACTLSCFIPVHLHVCRHQHWEAQMKGNNSFSLLPGQRWRS